MEGLKFRRQHPIGPYFADFACVAKKLVVEVDGDFHGDQVEADARRTAVIERAGWSVVRFTAREVLEYPEGIWVAIQARVNSPSMPPLPASPPSGGEEHEGVVR
jgi:very-short-patch-repair endonuclease